MSEYLSHAGLDVATNERVMISGRWLKPHVIISKWLLYTRVSTIFEYIAQIGYTNVIKLKDYHCR